MNKSIVNKTSEYFNKKGIILPTISELANPHIINQEYKDKLKTLDKNSVDPLNLFRVHWFNNRTSFWIKNNSSKESRSWKNK